MLKLRDILRLSRCHEVWQEQNDVVLKHEKYQKQHICIYITKMKLFIDLPNDKIKLTMLVKLLTFYDRQLKKYTALQKCESGSELPAVFLILNNKHIQVTFLKKKLPKTNLHVCPKPCKSQSQQQALDSMFSPTRQ